MPEGNNIYYIVLAIAALAAVVYMHVRSNATVAANSIVEEKVTTQPTSATTITSPEVINSSISSSGVEQTELIAIIAAAIAAYTGQNASDIKVASIRRVVNVETGWAAQARHDLIDARRL